jgi:integrase
LRYTLRTGFLGVAKQKSRFLAGQIQFMFQFLRRSLFDMGKLSEDQVQQLVGKYIKKSVAGMDEVFNQDGDQRPYFDEEGFHNYVDELTSIRGDLIAKLNIGNFSMLEGSIDTFLKENGIDEVDKGSPSYRKLCVEVHKAETKLIRIQKKHMQCDFSYKDDLPKLFPEVFPAKDDRPPERREKDDEPKKDKRKKVELSQVFKEYWEEKEPTLKRTSKPEYEHALGHFVTFAGKQSDIREIDGEVLREYKKLLLKEKVRGGKPRAVTTINNKYLTLVKEFFNYAKDHSYISVNPVVDGLKIKEGRGKKPDSKRPGFSIEDLRKMFCGTEYTQDTMEHPYQFWMPLIGLYTGMRINEVCQLYVSDLKQMDGFWCLDINADKPDKSVKNSQRRIVPLHSFLIDDLNFVGFVESLPDRDGRIFPELEWLKDRYSRRAGPWFSKFKERCGVVAESGSKAFHGFRHTVISHLFKQDAIYRNIQMFVGHKLTGVTNDYDDKLEPKGLYEKVVLKFNYDLDLSHLKNSKWVVK